MTRSINLDVRYIARYISPDMKTDFGSFAEDIPHPVLACCEPGGGSGRWYRRERRAHFRQFVRDFMRGRWGAGGWAGHGGGPSEEWGPFSAFFGGPRGRFFGFGEARLAILSLLKDGPKHGYQLIKELEQRSGGLYRASAGTVYPTLQQLEDETLVRSEQQEGRKIFSLTEAGAQEVEREKEAIERIWRRAEQWGHWGDWASPEAFPLFRPLGALVKTVFRAARWAGHDPDRQEQIVEILDKARRQLRNLFEDEE
jgi:DNA-binding PadR family transcriptional regulator